MILVKKQSGMSAIEILCYGFTICVLGMAAVKIAPSYYDAEFVVVKGLEALRDDPELADKNKGQLKSALGKYFSINGIRDEAANGVVVKRISEGYLVNVDYTVERPLYKHIDLKMHYQYQLNTVTKECCEYLIEDVEE